MNSFFAKELGRELTAARFGTAEYGALADKLMAMPVVEREQVIRAAETLIYERDGARVSMALGHIAERAQVRFAG
jgi:hypothetical protein